MALFARFSTGLAFYAFFLFTESSSLFLSSPLLFRTCFAHLYSTILIGTALLINAVSFLMIRKIVQIICITKVKQTMKNEVSKLEGH